MVSAVVSFDSGTGPAYGCTCLVDKVWATVEPKVGVSVASAVIMATEAGADALNVSSTATENVEWSGPL